MRLLIWAYLWLLLFEGAIRKWIAPGLDAPLLVIRDPIVALDLLRGPAPPALVFQ